jgi:anti-anti-sigma factor
LAGLSEHEPFPDGRAVAHDPVPFRCDVLAVKDHAVLTVRGEFDLATAPEFCRALLRAIDMPVTALTVDLSYVTFLDSSGIHSLVTAQNTAREGGLGFRLESVPRHVRKVLEVCHLVEYFGLPAQSERFPA